MKILYHLQYNSLFLSNIPVRLAAMSNLIPDPSSVRKLFLPSFNLYRVIISYPKLLALDVLALAIGRLSTVLATFENNVSHCKAVCGWSVLTPIFSKDSRNDLILRSTRPSL